MTIGETNTHNTTIKLWQRQGEIESNSCKQPSHIDASLQAPIPFYPNKKRARSMKKQTGIFITTLILAAFSTTVSAMMPCIFCGDVREEICRNCHEDLEALPMLKMRNPDRHHLLIKTPIPPLSRSKAPDAPGGTPGDPYVCFSCHTLNWGDNGADIQPFRDCLICHPIWRVTGPPMRGNNVHHETETFRQRKCWTCHSRTGGVAADSTTTGTTGRGMGM